MNPTVKAFSLHQSGELDEAYRLYKSLTLEHPEDPEILHLLGICCGQMQNWEESAHHLERAL